MRIYAPLLTPCACRPGPNHSKSDRPKPHNCTSALARPSKVDGCPREAQRTHRARHCHEAIGKSQKLLGRHVEQVKPYEHHDGARVPDGIRGLDTKCGGPAEMQRPSHAIQKSG
eukprot:518814-Prymnesium_polylepis.4